MAITTTTTTRSSSGARILLLLALVAGPAVALAEGGGVVLRAGAFHSDNISHSPSGEPATATTGTLIGAAFNLERKEGGAQGKLVGNLDLNNYRLGWLNSQLTGSVVADGKLQLVPRILSWNADFDFGQARRDLLRSMQPGNLENIAHIRTGPRLSLRLSEALEAEGEGIFSRTWYQFQNFDSTSVGGRGALMHVSSPKTRIGLGGAVEKVKYLGAQGAAIPELRRVEGFVRWQTQGVRSSLNIDAGQAHVRGGEINTSGLIVRASADRRITPSLKGTLSWNREFPAVDTSREPRVGGPTNLIDLSVLTAGPRRTDSISGGLTLTRPRTTAEFSYWRTREESLLQYSQRSADQWHLALRRTIGNKSEVGGYVDLWNEHFSAIDQSVRENTVGAYWYATITGRFGVDLVVQRSQRIGAIVMQPYNETLIGAYARYGLLAPGIPR